MERNLSGKAKCGVCRKARLVYLVFEFPSEYDAMQAFDIWSMEDITVDFKGPKRVTELEDSADA